MMKTLQWGTIGCGDVVERKGGPPLWGIDGCSLVAVMRRTGEKAREFAEAHDVARWYDSVEALLADEEINAVYIATPNDTHLEPTLAAIAAGKDVLVEKPMARNTAACQEMIDAATQAGVILAVAYYRRCYPTMLRCKEWLEADVIGTPRELRINDEFPLSHRLDLVHFFFGELAEVWVQEENLLPGSNAAHGPVLYGRTKNGVLFQMNVGWHETGAPETVLIRGRDGEIEVDDLKGGHLFLRSGDNHREETFEPLAATHWGLVQNFLDHVNGRAPLACDGVEGRKSTVIMDLVEQLPAYGTKQTVDYS